MKNKKFLKVFDLRAWYITHIILLISFTVILGNFLGDKIGLFNWFTSGSFGNYFIVIIWYSIFAYLFDTLFHSITGLD